MSQELITAAFASVYLISIPWFTTTKDGFDTFAFRVAPTLIGIALAFQTYGKWRGWPI